MSLHMFCKLTFLNGILLVGGKRSKLATMYVISFIFSDARCIIFKDFQIASVLFVHFSRKMRNREDLSVNVYYNVSYVVTFFRFLQ